jgi:DNA-directed RNA polymerase subunit RPC12/RpoP
MHTCSNCQATFQGTTNRSRDISWKSIFTRPSALFPLGEDIESFESVKCPKCGYVENSSEFRIFGFIPGSKRNIKLVLCGLLVAILLFGYWLFAVFSPAFG